MIGSSVNSPICGVNRLFYLRVRCKITVAVFLTLRWYLSVRCGESIDDVTAQRPLKSSSCSLSHSLQYAQGHAAHGGSHHAILDCQRRNGVLLDVWKLARTHLQTSNHRAAIASDTKLYARTVSSSRSACAFVYSHTLEMRLAIGNVEVGACSNSKGK
jgi:hypothetical protein